MTLAVVVVISATRTVSLKVNPNREKPHKSKTRKTNPI